MAAPSASGFHAELDELRDISRNSRQYIAQIELRERARTGIQSLKVRFNNVFGYYIEISKANLHLAPADYERKQTLVNAERFTTPELKELESKVLDAEEKMLALEREIFQELRLFAAEHAARIRQTAAAIAELDVTCALAQVAAENRYVRPSFSDSGEMRIVAGRHPVIEKLAEKEALRFIPNDLYFDPESQFIAVITGPNMGGKSTYLRQAAAIVILAQMGSFVPADSAALPHRGSRLHAHRRGRQSGARAVDVHGGDDRDRRDSEHGDGAQPGGAGRDRPRHGDLRRAGAGVGRGGAHSSAHSRAHAVRDALSRADGAGRSVAGRPQSACFGEGSGRPDDLPAQSGAGARRPQLWHRSGAAGGAADVGDRARAGDSGAARAIRAGGHRGTDAARRRRRRRSNCSSR